MEPQNQTGNQEPRTLSALQGSVGRESSLPAISPGFGSLQGYELMLRQSKALAASTLVPPQYRAVIVKLNRDGSVRSTEENANAIPNCMIALNMATRMNADPLMVMQNLVVVEGRPSWSSQWVIAQINNCGRFEPLRFDLQEKGRRKVTMEYTEWVNNQRQRKTREVEVDDIECIAWTVPKGVKMPPGVLTLEDAKTAKLPVLKGPKVSINMAVQEGWYTKTGSKWVTMPELMLHYRSGSFFGRLYAPELLMGIPSEDEVRDMGTLVQGSDGAFAPEGGDDSLNPSIDSLRRTAAAHAHSDDSGDERGAETVQVKPQAGSDAAGKTTTAPAEKPAAEAAADKPTAAAEASKPTTTAAAASQPSDDGTLFGKTD